MSPARVAKVNVCARIVPLVAPVLAALALTGVLSGPLAAQSEGEALGGGGFFAIGFQELGAGELDRRLGGAGLPGVGSAALTLGGGGYAAFGRWRVGGEGHGLRGSRRMATDGGFETRAGGGYGLFTVGYDLVSSARFEVTPFLGVGGGGATAEIDGRGAASFDEILAEPRRGVRLSQRSFLGSLGVGVRRTLFGSGRKPLVLGVRAGYLLPFARSGWSSGGTRIAGGPGFAADGFHIHLTIGR